MLIGVPKEIKSNEHRVGMVPSSVREVIQHGHSVLVETGAGNAIGFTDSDYEQLGARIALSAGEVYANSEMIVKVKELQTHEFDLLRENQILFTYLHLAPDPEQTNSLLRSGCIGIAYETVTDNAGELPLLTPMSQVAGRLSIQAGAHCLEKHNGGSGILVGGVPGVSPAKVVVLGGGVVGVNAIRMAIGLEAHVTVIDKSLSRLKELDSQFGAKLTTVFATADAIETYVENADLVIGAVLIPGAAAPKLVTSKMIQNMRPGSVIVDVAIDQGGCFETSHPTTHADPTYILEGIVHYCVTNMPAAVPRTATFALNNATLPFILDIANKGYERALIEDNNLLNGLNVYKGMLTQKAVAEVQNLPFVSAKQALGIKLAS